MTELNRYQKRQAQGRAKRAARLALAEMRAKLVAVSAGGDK